MFQYIHAFQGGGDLPGHSPQLAVLLQQKLADHVLRRRVRQQRRVTLPRVGLFADGVAVRKVGDITFDLCRELVGRYVLVSEAEIADAIRYSETGRARGKIIIEVND